MRSLKSLCDPINVDVLIEEENQTQPVTPVIYFVKLLSWGGKMGRELCKEQ